MARVGRQIARRVALLLALVLLLGATPVLAQRIALLPLADFSRGENGVNLPFTRDVARSLQRLGVEMVPQDEVLAFMRRNRVRSFSYLDTFLAKKIGQDLHCAVALLGTVTEIGGAQPKLGLTFTALDTVSGFPVWSETGATSVLEQARLLALGEPQTVAELTGPLLDRLLVRLGSEVKAAGVPDSREYQLAGLQLFPAYVRGRQQIDATLKIRFLAARPNRVIVESKAGPSYLHLDSSGSYSGKWFAPDHDGNYPVSLILEWGAGGYQERIENIASYHVINDPPGLRIEIKKGQQIDGELAFRDHLLILPRLDDLKPLSRWGLQIRNADGVVLVNEEYEGDIPERMVWEGLGSDGFYLADGRYDITLQVWDLAGNSSSASRRVVMQRNAPMVDARVVDRNGKAVLQISAVNAAVYPLIGWTANLKTGDGQKLLEIAGEQLPREVEFSAPAGTQTTYFGFSGEDRLGNRRKIVRKELPMKIEKPASEEQEAESWVPDF